MTTIKPFLLVFTLTALAVPQDIRYEPHTSRLLNETVEVPAGGYYYYKFPVGIGIPNQHDPVLWVNYTAHGGGGNDIVVTVLPMSEWSNWVNGHAAAVCYTSPGKQTTGKFTVRDFVKGVGYYVLVFDNRFSPFSRKFVEAQVDFSYDLALFDKEF